MTFFFSSKCYSPSGGTRLSVGGVFEKHALDTIGFPGFVGVSERNMDSMLGMASGHVDFNVEA